MHDELYSMRTSPDETGMIVRDPAPQSDVLHCAAVRAEIGARAPLIPLRAPAGQPGPAT